jgi:phospholipid/cholesterol/gamma-HCH transport system permease protein
MSFLNNIGAGWVDKGRTWRHYIAMLWSVTCIAVQPRYWPRTTRNVFARQVLFTGVEAWKFIALIACMVGLSIVVQFQVWLTKFGQTQLLGPILVMAVVRELGPLLVNFIIIGRSGTAMAIEMGNMQIAGEVRALDAQGLDPFTYLVLPRVAGAAVSIFCLTIIFIVVAFFSGYLCGVLTGAQTGNPLRFLESIFGALQQADVFNVLIKTLVCGAMTGVICCAEGLSVSTASTEVPQAATRAVVRSTAALFVMSALVSLVTYF